MTTTLEIETDSFTSTQEFWSYVQMQLRLEYGEATYKSWLSKLTFISNNNGQVLLSVPSKFMRDWIITHYMNDIVKFAQSSGYPVVDINIVIAKLDDNLKASTVISETEITRPKFKSAQYQDLESILDERFTFENFVVGSTNELAYAAAKSVAESNKVQPGSNPLFIYGQVGLGKTHLLQSIAWYVSKNDKSRRVVYMSAEKFMYQFVRSIREKNIMEFKEYFRSVDVLLIDDVQFICGKDSTQEEFFHTFNALIDNNCQIVISADRSPSDLTSMDERIRSRLGWGLVVDINNPDYDLRLGILNSKLAMIGSAEIPAEVLEFLAAKITSSIRELEGALNKVVAHSRFVGRKIDFDSTKEILRDLIRANDKVVTIEEIQKIVANYFDIKVSDINSAKKVRTIARPRQVAMYLAKNLTSNSFAEIGRKFGNKDHATVMHANKNIEKLLASDRELQDALKVINKMLEI